MFVFFYWNAGSCTYLLSFEVFWKPIIGCIWHLNSVRMCVYIYTNINSKSEKEISCKECYISSLCLYFVPPKLMWLLKLPFDQNSIVIYHIFNGNFKSQVNFGGIQRWYVALLISCSSRVAGNIDDFVGDHSLDKLIFFICLRLFNKYY
jgi:hypothetical protein